MAQAAYFYAAGETQKQKQKYSKQKENRRSNRRPARTPILDRNSKYNHQAGTISGKPGNRRKTGKAIREYTERKMSETPPRIHRQ